MTESAVVAAVFVICGGIAAVYGLLEIFTPQVAITLQIRSTAKARGVRRAVGRAFQQAFGMEPAAVPWNDPALRRRVRAIGFILLAFGAVVIVAGVRIWDGS
jgi:hypothetical protein